MKRPTISTRGCGLLVAVALLNGCATYGGSRRVAKVGAAVVLVGAASMAAGVALSGDNIELVPYTLFLGGAFVVLPAGGILVASGLLGMGYHALYPTQVEPRDRVSAQAMTHHLDDRLGLAIEAARAADCKSVEDLATEVSRANRDYYCNSFLRVPDLERCASVLSPCSSPSSW